MLRRLLTQIVGRRTRSLADFGLLNNAPMRDAVVSPAAGRRSAPRVDLPSGLADAPPQWHTGTISKIESLSIIVPILPGRIGFLRQMLAHFDQSAYGCTIVMTVNSDAEHEPEIEDAVSRHPDLKVVILYHPMSMHFLQRLNACAREVRTTYVVVHSDDDFMVPPALRACVAFLDQHPDYAACQGRSFFYRVLSAEIIEPQPQRFLTRDEPTVSARILAHCTNYTNTFHAVTRLDAFRESNARVLDFTSNVIFWQYLASCWLLSLGKLKVLDDLYYLRLDNPIGVRSVLVREGNKTHWPYLVVAPDFSDEMQRFRAGLIAAMAGEAPPNVEEIVDDSCIGLVRRAFGGQLTFSRIELEMHVRFGDAQSYEAVVARYCGTRSVASMRANGL